MVTQLLKLFLAVCGTRKFITVFTMAHHQLLSWTRWIQSTNSYHISLRFILKSFHLLQGLQRGLLPSDFPTQILYAFLISPMRATCRTHVIFLDFVTIIIFGETYNLW